MATPPRARTTPPGLQPWPRPDTHTASGSPSAAPPASLTGTAAAGGNGVSSACHGEGCRGPSVLSTAEANQSSGPAPGSPTHRSDSWMTRAFSRASRPGPTGRPTAERQPPLGSDSEGPELSIVSARGSQGGRRGSPCPRIRALWKKVLISGGMGLGPGGEQQGGRGWYLGWEVSALPGASWARGGGAGATVPAGGVPPSPRGMVTS